MLSEDARDYFRQAAARRRRLTVACTICGTTIAHTLAWRRYCSNACRQRAKRQRQASRAREGG